MGLNQYATLHSFNLWVLGSIPSAVNFPCQSDSRGHFPAKRMALGGAERYNLNVCNLVIIGPGYCLIGRGGIPSGTQHDLLARVERRLTVSIGSAAMSFGRRSLSR
jgi:hypothetical protein